MYESKIFGRDYIGIFRINIKHCQNYVSGFLFFQCLPFLVIPIKRMKMQSRQRAVGNKAKFIEQQYKAPEEGGNLRGLLSEFLSEVLFVCFFMRSLVGCFNLISPMDSFFQGNASQQPWGSRGWWSILPDKSLCLNTPQAVELALGPGLGHPRPFSSFLSHTSFKSSQQEDLKQGH